MRLENTPANKERFIALYWGQEVLLDENNAGRAVLYPVDRSNMYRLEESSLELTPLSQITDEDAIEVARILHGESDEFAIEFNAVGITSVSPYGLPCYGPTIDINWSGEICYERASSMGLLKAYDLLRGKSYYVGDGTEVEYGWVKLREK